MKILIDARESGTSTGRYVDKLVEHLYKLSSEHAFTILTRPERVEFMKKIARSFETVETTFREFTFDEQLGLKKQIDQLKPDLVHFTMTQQPVRYQGRSVTTMHDLTTVRFRNPAKNPLIFWTKQQVYKWVNKKVARKSVAVITPTQFVKDDVVAFTHISPKKVVVTLEAADAITDKPAVVQGLENKRFIMYVGRPTPHKNLARLIDAFVELQKERPELRLVLAGKKDYNYEIHATSVKERGIKGVMFTDFISDGELRWLYEHCLAYVFPSLSEGFGLPGLEAMLHGAPVVSSDATCLPEVYGDAAYYFDPTSVADMATKIGDVLEDPILREDLVEKGKKQAANYSWKRMAEQTLTIYDEALR